MALSLSAQDGRPGTGSMSSTARHAALGGRWLGSKAAVIDKDLIQACADHMEAGKVSDLNFHFKFISQIAGLEPHAPHLRTLDLSTNNIRQIEGLQGMNKLRELKLYGCQISRISNLEPCVSLLALHLEDNAISAVEGLDNLKSLEYLSLDSNKIQKLGKGLLKLSKLKELHVSRNRLTGLEGLSGLCSLEVLAASHNQVQSVGTEQVKALAKLDELRLEGNQLGTLSFLVGSSGSPQPLPSLATLDVSCNRLASEALRGLPVLPQLMELNLAGNQIREIPADVASSWASLEILDLSGNQLESLAQLERLRELVSLRELALEGNPVASSEEGQGELSRVLSTMDALEVLDEKPRPQAPAPQALEDGEGDEEANMFALTASRAVLGATGSRPGTASRPSTSSRPSTAQSMKEAGIQQPLMHARLKVTDRRFANEDQIMEWEKQTMNSLAAIERQIERTEQMAESELRHMDRYLQKADKLWQRQRELQAQGRFPAVPEGQEGPGSPARPLGGTLTPSQAQPSSRPASQPNPVLSRSARRLREAVVTARDEAPAPPPEAERPKAGGSVPSPTALASHRRREAELAAAATLPAACDEEIVDNSPRVEAGSGTDVEDDAAQVATEVEDNAAAAASEAEERARAQLARADLRLGVRAGARRSRRAAPGSGAGARKPPLAVPARVR